MQISKTHSIKTSGISSVTFILNKTARPLSPPHTHTHTHTHTHAHTMEYYSGIKVKEFLPFVTRWMDLEGTMLIEVSQSKTNTVWSHLHVESKQNTFKLIEKDIQIYGYQRWHEVVGDWVKAQTSICKIIRYKSTRDVTYKVNTIVNTVLWCT